ncbi:NAD(P)-binding protein [Photobacterium sp. GJ3]|uniref:NAD(P)-binding protein n=1 Tax=Photobacterium sp. GJ3 TaxID=2829502 RepID=UPI001B8B79C0|nr:NAD(P)-binding protein [Photobacterium sp. GJ3]QUJ68013.1 NAD(P)-binding protein [Photobacterium sp. GJ3]
MSDVSLLEDAFHGLLPFEQDEIAQAYQAYLKSGLPESNTESKHILILGCGIAGMVSAALLRKAGHRVTIVEGNTRVGGGSGHFEIPRKSDILKMTIYRLKLAQCEFRINTNWCSI